MLTQRLRSRTATAFGSRAAVGSGWGGLDFARPTDCLPGGRSGQRPPRPPEHTLVADPAYGGGGLLGVHEVRREPGAEHALAVGTHAVEADVGEDPSTPIAQVRLVAGRRIADVAVDLLDRAGHYAGRRPHRGGVGVDEVPGAGQVVEDVNVRRDQGSVDGVEGGLAHHDLLDVLRHQRHGVRRGVGEHLAVHVGLDVDRAGTRGSSAWSMRGAWQEVPTHQVGYTSR